MEQLRLFEFKVPNLDQVRADFPSVIWNEVVWCAYLKADTAVFEHILDDIGCGGRSVKGHNKPKKVKETVDPL